MPNRVRDSAYRIGAIARHNTLIRLRDPGQMIAYIVMPMILMLVLKPLYVKAVQGGTLQVVTGLLVMFSVFAIGVAGNSILVERNWQTWDRLRQSRANAAEDLCAEVAVVLGVGAQRVRGQGEAGEEPHDGQGLLVEDTPFAACHVPCDSPEHRSQGRTELCDSRRPATAVGAIRARIENARNAHDAVVRAHLKRVGKKIEDEERAADESG